MADCSYLLDIYKGKTFSLVISTTDTDYGTAIDFSGYSLSGQLKNKYTDGEPLIGLTVSPQSPLASGIFVISLTDAETASLPVSQLIYFVNGSFQGVTQEFIAGYANVYP